MGSRGGIHELRRNTQTFTRLLHAAFKQVTHIQRPTHGAHIARLFLQRK